MRILESCQRPGGFVLAGLLLIAGCENQSGRHVVSGNVRWKSEPISEGTIVFASLEKGSTTNAGATIRNGRYSIPADKGLLPGSYEVRISQTRPLPGAKPGPDGSLDSEELLPSCYNAKTELKVEVREGSSAVFDFDLRP